MKTVGTSTLDILLSFQPIIWTVFGGMGTIHGAVAGVFILYPLAEALRVVPAARMLIYFFILIIVLLFMPEGLNPRILDRIQITCPRCKLTNAATRKNCRACGALLRPERE
jgi:branched-chain amino acid transport system permease protein